MNDSKRTDCPKCSNSRRKDTRGYFICVSCNTKRARDLRHSNPSKFKNQRDSYEKRNKESLFHKRKVYHETNRDKLHAYDKKYRTINREAMLSRLKRNRETRHPLYKTWEAMKRRCFNSNV